MDDVILGNTELDDDDDDDNAIALGLDPRSKFDLFLYGLIEDEAAAAAALVMPERYVWC